MNTLFHFQGLIIGALTFLIIGLFHPLVVKGEYYLGAPACRIIFLIAAIAAITASILSADVIPSTIAGIIGFSSLWSIKEVNEQVRRVEKGWFPRNPRKHRRKPRN
ncbi:MAG: DUF4491 family protein [Lachnoclostridium sp.]|nr:DUF4491 family protein [Lachnoclostridium sp.]